MLDLIIKNGYIINKAGRRERLNIMVNNGLIVDITEKCIEAQKTIDVNGLVVAPGFVDIHTHEDEIQNGNMHFTDDQEFHGAKALLNMGVTTAVGGNCGYSAIDISVYKNHIKEKGYLHNFAGLLGYNSLREYFGIDRYEEADDSQINKMQKLLIKNMDEGAFGFSAGIAYNPGISSKELIQMAEVAAEYNGYFTVHLIGNPAAAVNNLKEMISVSQKTGIKLQISHVGSLAAYGYMDELLRTITDAADAGLPVRGDCYPYHAFCTSLGSAVFDKGFEDRLNCRLEQIEVVQGKYKGQRLDADLFKEIRHNNSDTLIVAHVMREEEIIKALKNKYIFVASDLTLNDGEGHPRAAGTFPRLLGHYCREEGIMSFAEGLKKSTSEPSSWFDIDGRGEIIEGGIADLVVLNQDTIIDRASFTDPLLPPEGIEYVIVNGKISLENNTIKASNGIWLNHQK